MSQRRARGSVQRRRRARHALLQALFEWHWHDPERSTESTCQWLESQGNLDGADVGFFRFLLGSVTRNYQALDKKFKPFLDRELSELGPMELAVLRVGTQELLSYPELDQAITVNEWVELEKRFGQENGHKYINAVLDKVATTRNKGEFALIDLITAELGPVDSLDLVRVGPGDDAGVLKVPAGHEIVATTDTLLAGTHFPVDCPPELIAFRSAAVTLSDVAAMGASPSCVLVSLVTTESEPSWFRQFARGVRLCVSRYGSTVLGGNLAKGPLSVTVTGIGSLPVGSALTRSDAQVGDDIWLSGRVGATAVAAEQGFAVPSNDIEELLDVQDSDPIARYFLPHPRLEFAQTIRGIATAAVDVSDGLLADVGHIGSASEVGIELFAHRIPIWPEAKRESAIRVDDSYEIAFTASSDSDTRNQIEDAAENTQTPVLRIGSVSNGLATGVYLDGSRVTDPGFNHF